ncbi:hypothetical protein EOS_33065 [Caballeronia mineralivorans PML1(12)]|uniref:Uncharacterized protein n=1 Tax=Caballeronia mineralivorans PML1(12) TaxID=908627 RepID=A0A0J1CN50_9BURK|nr:hypothetical protein [Caballeronia mineralivorans]KLU21974.1 hypothetical protein EOS_33065 [Caballeronia mineralivorans PML1(12)]
MNQKRILSNPGKPGGAIDTVVLDVNMNVTFAGEYGAVTHNNKTSVLVPRGSGTPNVSVSN